MAQPPKGADRPSFREQGEASRLRLEAAMLVGEPTALDATSVRAPLGVSSSSAKTEPALTVGQSF